MADGTNQRARTDITVDSFRLKQICKSCNNGWMSELENLAKPLILGLKPWRPESATWPSSDAALWD